jgi:hypothetical protein
MPTTSIAGDCTSAVTAQPRAGAVSDDSGNDVRFAKENVWIRVLSTRGVSAAKWYVNDSGDAL